MTATLSQSILWQMAIMDALWTISWVSYPRLLAIRFLWQIWHWQSCNTSALLLVFGPLTHSDIFGCSIQSTTENWSREKIDLFRDLCGLVYNRVYRHAGINMCEWVCTCMYVKVWKFCACECVCIFTSERACPFQISCTPEPANIQCWLLWRLYGHLSTNVYVSVCF